MLMLVVVVKSSSPPALAPALAVRRSVRALLRLLPLPLPCSHRPIIQPICFRNPRPNGPHHLHPFPLHHSNNNNNNNNNKSGRCAAVLMALLSRVWHSTSSYCMRTSRGSTS